MKSIFNIVTLESKRGCRGREGGADTAADVERIAVHLADRLADWKSLAFFRLVARSVPEQEIHRALRLALDIPRSEVRRSRAAYFTALVRPFLPSLDTRRNPSGQRSETST